MTMIQSILSPPWTNLTSGIFWFSCSWFGTFGLLSKKILPRFTFGPLSRLFFWPMLPLTYLSRNLPWSPPYYIEISTGVFLGAVPLVAAGHVQELHRLGVRAVVNMMDEYNGPSHEYQRLGIKQLRLPVIDHMEPTVQQMRSAVQFMQEETATGSKVYVHCRGGHGRGGAVAFAWLLNENGAGLSETQQLLSSLRKVRSKLWKQKNIVEYYEELKN